MRLRPWFVLSAALVPAPGAAQSSGPPTGALEVTITGIRAQQGGVLVVALYDAESRWLTLDSARTVQRLTPTADSVVTLFEDVPVDSSFAIAVIHDKNGNDKMDMRWFPFPKPKEGAGVSRNNLRMGKPRYDQARFVQVAPVEQLHITMRY